MSRITPRVLAPLLPLAAALALAAGASFAQEGGRPLDASLNGASEAPGPGDPDGHGTAKFTVSIGQSQVCFELNVSGVDPAVAAHIHKGAPGVAGPIVVGLTPPSGGSSKGCVDVVQDLAKDILKNPGDYYTNVHTAAFPAGAVRGQLTAPPPGPKTVPAPKS